MARMKKRELQRFQQYFACLSDRRRTQPANDAAAANDDQAATSKAS
jgi:hypothetical protein